MNHRRAQISAKWIVLAAIGVVIAAGIIVVAFRLAQPKVVVTEAVEGPVVQAFYSTGTVQPQREYPIKSNLAGILTEVKVDKGDRVRANQALAVVSDPELQFIERKAAAELEEKWARAEPQTSPVLKEIDARIAAWSSLLNIAQREEERIRKLIETNAASQQDLDLATNRLKTAWSEVESFKAQRASRELELQRELAEAQSAHDIAKWNLEQQTLKSPIDGVVLDRPLAVGTRVAINDAVMTVADVTPENLVIRAAVDEEDIAKVQPDQKVHMTLYSFEGRVLRGTVTRIYDQADPDRRTFEVDVKLDEPEPKLLPGMTGELAFILAARDRSLVIPSQALQGDSVWLVENGKLIRKQPQIGIKSVERVEVLTELKPGDRVVVSAVGDVSEGTRVRTSYIDPAVAAGLNRKVVEEQPFKAFD